MRHSIIILVLLVIGCSSPEKIAARKAAKESVAREAEMKQLEKVRQKYPCDTATQYVVIRDTATWYRLDTAKSNDTVFITKSIASTVYRDRVVRVLDQAALKAARDSSDQMSYMWDQMRQQYTTESERNDKLQAELKDAEADKVAWQKRAWYTWAGIALAIGGGIFSKIKGII